MHISFMYIDLCRCMCNAYKLYVRTLTCVGVCVMHISFTYIDLCRCMCNAYKLYVH